MPKPSAAPPGARKDDLLKEWQEARAVVDRLDGTLVDLRKYGFGLASGLLTANGLIFGLAKTTGATTQVIAVVVAVTMLLTAVLFVVDQYYHVIQWSATNRAVDLETTLHLGLSKEILRWATWKEPKGLSERDEEATKGAFDRARLKVAIWTTRLIWNNLAPIQYGSFILAGAALAVSLMGGDAIPSPQHVAADFMWIVLIFSFVLIWSVRWLAGRERDTLSSA